MSDWPGYDHLIQKDYKQIDGYHSLGLIASHRPDIELVSLHGHTIEDRNFDWLESSIDTALANNKKVAIIVWDEDWMWPHNQQLFDLLNSYAEDPVWWITQIDRMEEWHEYRGLRIKCLEVQWWMLNDCLSYKELYTPVQLETNMEYNYLCMLGRYEPHKHALGKKLHTAELTQYGMTTVAYPKDYPNDHVGWSKSNPVKLYPKLNFFDGKTRSNAQYGNTWASGNVENWLNLEPVFANVPLVINPDSGFGIFQLNDKHIWPPLLGKLFLIYGRAYVMSTVQRFYDVDISKYANLEFDSILDHDQRLEAMIDLNQDLIRNCKDIYQELKPELEQARWKLGANLYKFCIEQLDTIQ